MNCVRFFFDTKYAEKERLLLSFDIQKFVSTKSIIKIKTLKDLLTFKQLKICLTNQQASQ